MESYEGLFYSALNEQLTLTVNISNRHVMYAE